MNPVVRALGKVLRLVGISSPEDTADTADTAAKPKSAGGPPSWRDQQAAKPEDRKS
jgi:hypothetical protein